MPVGWVINPALPRERRALTPPARALVALVWAATSSLVPKATFTYKKQTVTKHKFSVLVETVMFCKKGVKTSVNRVKA